jgi:hypothetical protein
MMRFCCENFVVFWSSQTNVFFDQILKRRRMIM